jgi:AcrR family transcriptional regulator
MLDAASRLFAQRGYAGTTTREIAREAGIAEVLIFRHYGSKANLFRQAVFDPFYQFLREFVDDWSNRKYEQLGDDEFAYDYISRLYNVLRSKKWTIRALLAAEAYEHGITEDGEVGGSRSFDFDDLFREADQIIAHEIRAREMPGVDLVLAHRIVFGMVLAAAVHEEWLMTRAGAALDHEELIREMSRMAVHGVAHRERSDEPAPRAVEARGAEHRSDR